MEKRGLDLWRIHPGSELDTDGSGGPPRWGEGVKNRLKCQELFLDIEMNIYIYYVRAINGFFTMVINSISWIYGAFLK
jgi:hypothetical protein